MQGLLQAGKGGQEFLSESHSPTLELFQQSPHLKSEMLGFLLCQAADFFLNPVSQHAPIVVVSTGVLQSAGKADLFLQPCRPDRVEDLHGIAQFLGRNPQFVKLQVGGLAEIIAGRKGQNRRRKFP